MHNERTLHFTFLPGEAKAKRPGVFSRRLEFDSSPFVVLGLGAALAGPGGALHRSTGMYSSANILRTSIRVFLKVPVSTILIKCNGIDLRAL